ncbi:MAG: GGDEF domain-containing protein [Deltaproteobacteria bacterium]|nr:GGDEF domain-containing protein [Deltaproteobacteria bacterium]
MAEMPEFSQGRYKRIFGVLFQLTKLVNSGAALPDLLRAVATSAVDLVGADACSIMLLDDARQELLCKASHGLPAEDEAEIRFKVGEGVAGWVAEHGAPALITDVSADARFKKLDGQAANIESLLAVPLATRDGVIGVITVTSARHDAFASDHQELLAYLGGSIVKDIENARLYRLSITDSLTKAYNRQYLYQRLPEEIDRARRYGDPFSLVLFDLDHFKALNDKHGHPAGDFVLKEVVRVAQATVREVDGLVRYGGEEFLVLLPKTALAGAVQTAERVRAAVQGLSLPWSDQKLKVTASFGVAQVRENEPDDELLRRADEALYAAKGSGRNRVIQG